MSHFLGSRVRRFPTMWLGRIYAAVKVRVTKTRPPVLQVQPSSVVVLSGVELFHLPHDVMVIGPDGESLAPTGEFLVSVETVDPVHYLVDDHAIARW